MKNSSNRFLFNWLETKNSSYFFSKHITQILQMKDEIIHSAIITLTYKEST